MQVIPVLWEVVGVGYALEIPDVDRFIWRFEKLPPKLIFKGIEWLWIRRARGLNRMWSWRCRSRKGQLLSAIGTVVPIGLNSGWRPLKRLSGECLSPAWGQGRIGQAQ